MLEVENAIAASFEDFNLVVETFDKTAVLALKEVVGDFLPPTLEPLEEIIKTVQAVVLDPLDPASDFGLGLFLGQVQVKDGGELFSQHIGLLCQHSMLEEASQDFAFFLVQVFGILAKGVET